MPISPSHSPVPRSALRTAPRTAPSPAFAASASSAGSPAASGPGIQSASGRRPLDPVAAAAEAGLVMEAGSPLEASVRLAAVAATRDCPVFLQGESGSGKELMARFLHRRSGRSACPFVAVNCAAISPQLIESELFGHRKGAFTGALDDNPGRFRLAAGGTLFLDEVGDMPLEVQTKVLRALQEKTVTPVGDRRDYPVDFRLVCATHKDLRKAVAEGRFREDLYYRVAVVEIRLPPLRERAGDILPLLRRFLEGQLGVREAESALEDLPPALLSLPFPGNVRELRNLVERYSVLREMGGGWEEAAGVSSGLPGAALKGPVSSREGTGAPEGPSAARIRNSRVTDREILDALSACGWHRARTSALLGVTRRALQYRLAKMALPASESVAGVRIDR